MDSQSIPVVDLQDFISGTAAQKDSFVDAVGRALTDTGFFALANHGIDAALIDKAYGVTTQFFELDEAAKRRYENQEMGGQRGFTSFGREHAKDHAAPDLKEFWHVGRELPMNHPLRKTYAPNIWPSEVASFKDTMLDLYSNLERCSMHLLQACSLFLGESRTLLSDMAVDGNTILRVIHYPPVAEDRHPASIRAAAHEDINLITLLCEATAGGLELLQRDGSWRPIHALRGQIVVDAGDMLQNLTNGLLKSTTHRVVNPDNSRQRRFSMPYFVHPRSEVSLNPLPGCIKKMGPSAKRFPDITAGEYLAQRLREIGLTK